MNIYLKRIFDIEFEYENENVTHKFLKVLSKNKNYPHALKFIEIMNSEKEDKQIESKVNELMTSIGIKVSLIYTTYVEYFLDNLKYYENVGLYPYNREKYLASENRYEYLLKVSDDDLEKNFFPNVFTDRKEYIENIVMNSLKFHCDINIEKYLLYKKVYKVDKGTPKSYSELTDEQKEIADVYIQNCIQKQKNN